MLIINRQEIKGTRIAIDEEHLYAEVPLFYILQQLGIPVKWLDDTTATITAWGKDYILDTTKGTLVSAETGFNIFAVPPGTGHATTYKFEGENFIIDSDSASWFFNNVLHATMKVDHDTRFISFYHMDQMPADVALEIAEEMILKYKHYLWYGVCCDFEYHDEDMSQYMTEAQLHPNGDDYCGDQIRLTCCHSLDEIHEHLRQFMNEDLIKRWPDDMLFTDDKGSWYVPIVPTGGYGFSGIRLERYGYDEIVACADSSSEYEYDETIAFRIVQVDGHWRIEEIFTMATATNDPPSWLYS